MPKVPKRNRREGPTGTLTGRPGRFMCWEPLPGKPGIAHRIRDEQQARQLVEQNKISQENFDAVFSTEADDDPTLFTEDEDDDDESL